jgi:hypothetical protein
MGALLVQAHHLPPYRLCMKSLKRGSAGTEALLAKDGGYSHGVLMHFHGGWIIAMARRRVEILRRGVPDSLGLPGI